MPAISACRSGVSTSNMKILARALSTKTRSEFIIVDFLKVHLPAALKSFLESVRSRRLTRWRRFSHVFPNGVRQKFIEYRFEFGFSVLAVSVAIVDKGSHESALRKRYYAVNFRQLHTLREVELETLVVCNIMPFIGQVVDEFSARYVFRAGVCMHLRDCRTEHRFLYEHVVWTQRVGRVGLVKRRWV